MPRNQDKDGAAASARRTRSRSKRLHHTAHRGNDGFWYGNGNVFFSVKPLLFLQLERSRLQLVVCNGFFKKVQQVQHKLQFFCPATSRRERYPRRDKKCLAINSAANRMGMVWRDQENQIHGGGGITRYWTFSFAKTLNGDVPVPLEQAQGP